MEKPNFWDNQEYSNKVITELNEIKSVVKDISELSTRINDIELLFKENRN